jgi:hypothetical protein
MMTAAHGIHGVRSERGKPQSPMLPFAQFLCSSEGTVSSAIFGGTPSAAAIKG